MDVIGFFNLYFDRLFNHLSNKTDQHQISPCNHNYNKIVKSDWLSTALISALIGQFDRTVRVMPKYLDSTRHHARA